MQTSKSSPLVSIIVPVYNVQPFLERCITSLQQQTYSTIEILVIDDGSTDESLALCQAAAKQDNRIKVLEQANGGVATARNHGLDKARGDFICFVDSDDWVHPDYVTSLLQIMEQGQSDIAICNHWTIADGADESAAIVNDAFVEFQGPARDYYRRLLTDTRLHVQSFIWRCLYKRSVFEYLRFETGMLIEDVLLTMRLLSQTNLTITTSDQPRYYYVQHPNSTTRARAFTQRIANTVAFIERSPSYQGDELIYIQLNLLKYLPVYRWGKAAWRHPDDARLVCKLKPDPSAFIHKHWVRLGFWIDPRLGLFCDLLSLKLQKH